MNSRWLALILSLACVVTARAQNKMPVPVEDEPRYPPPLALAGLAAERIRGRAPGEVLTPLYLRRPDATEPGQPKAVTP